MTVFSRLYSRRTASEDSPRVVTRPLNVLTRPLADGDRSSFATSVSSRSLTLRQACVLAAFCEFLGAVLLGARVAGTIKNGRFRTLHPEPPKLTHSSRYVLKGGSLLGCTLISIDRHYLALDIPRQPRCPDARLHLRTRDECFVAHARNLQELASVDDLFDCFSSGWCWCRTRRRRLRAMGLE